MSRFNLRISTDDSIAISRIKSHTLSVYIVRVTFQIADVKSQIRARTISLSMIIFTKYKKLNFNFLCCFSFRRLSKHKHYRPYLYETVGRISRILNETFLIFMCQWRMAQGFPDHWEGIVLCQGMPKLRHLQTVSLVIKIYS